MSLFNRLRQYKESRKQRSEAKKWYQEFREGRRPLVRVETGDAEERWRQGQREVEARVQRQREKERERKKALFGGLYSNQHFKIILKEDPKLRKEWERCAITHTRKIKSLRIKTKAKIEAYLQEKEKNEALAGAYDRRRQPPLKSGLAGTVDDLLNLSPIEFENWVKKNVFERQGWVAQVTKRSGDKGVDLFLSKDGERAIAQCKRFKGTIGAPLLRDFYGAMRHEKVDRGFFVTTGRFSKEALVWCKNKPIELIDKIALIKYAKN